MHNTKDKETCEGHQTSADDYLINEISKPIGHRQMIKFNELPGCFPKLHKYEDSNVMEMKRMDMMANTCTIQLLRHREIRIQ